MYRKTRFGGFFALLFCKSGLVFAGRNCYNIRIMRKYRRMAETYIFYDGVLENVGENVSRKGFFGRNPAISFDESRNRT